MQEKESRNSAWVTFDNICCRFHALQSNMLDALSPCCDQVRKRGTNGAREALEELRNEINELADTLGFQLSVKRYERMFDTCYDCEVMQNHEHDTAPLEVVSSRDYLFR